MRIGSPSFCGSVLTPAARPSAARSCFTRTRRCSMRACDRPWRLRGPQPQIPQGGRSGYMFRAATVQDFSAVTGACLLVKTSVWDEVGGLDEAFAVAFNDVDFCLRVRDAGYRIAWTPYAQLTHYESKSRGGDEKDPVKARRFAAEQQRLYAVHGKANILHDPYYNPNLTMDRGFFRKR